MRFPFPAAAVVLALVSGAVAPASRAKEPDRDDPGTVRAHQDFILDEYNIDVLGGGDDARVAVGLTFGNGFGNGWWWNGGARVSWLRWQVDVPTQKGFGLGGTVGGGFHPDRTVSPFAAFSLDRAFSLGGAADWVATVLAGARVRVTRDPHEYFSMTFGVYRASGFGGDGPGGGDFGIAVLYSATLEAKKR
jgi:hypothetical protein